MLNLIPVSFLMGIIIVAVIAMIVFWIWAIIDCIKSDSTAEYKLLWLIIIIFLNIIGAILYLLFSKQTTSMQIDNKKSGKKLTRSSEDKVIAGVCGGLANYFDIDSSIVRIIWVLLTIFVTGAGLIVYIIAAIILPTDKMIKNNNGKNDKKQEKSGTKKIDPKKKSEKKTKTRSKNPWIYIGIILLVFFVIASIVISAFIAYNITSSDIHEEISLKEISVHVTDKELSESEIIEKIKSSPNYEDFEGYNLLLVEIKEPSKEKCTLFQKDPYGLKIYDSSCREYVHKFSIKEHETISGFVVNTIVTREEIIEMSFKEILQNDSDTTNDDAIKLVECTSQQRDADFCTAEYAPVCGYFEYPDNCTDCSQTYSNECTACKDPDVQYWTLGEC